MLRLPPIDPVAIYLGPLQVSWVALFYLAAFGVASRIGRRWGGRCADLAVMPAEWDSAWVWCAFGALALTRFAARLTASGVTVGNAPDWILYGGMLCVFLGSALVARVRKRAWWPVADLLALTAPAFLTAHGLGQLIGQTGWGRPTGWPWGMVFPEVDGLPRHPVPLYVVTVQGAVLFLALHRYARRRPPSGALFAWFLTGVGASESLLAPLRAQDPGNLHLRGGLAVMAIGFLLLIRLFRQQGKAIAGGTAGNAVKADAPATASRGGWRTRVPVKSLLIMVLIAGLVTMSHLYKPPIRTAAGWTQIRFPDLHGVPQSLGQWRGKVVVLNFWATWCPPCRQEVPVLEAAQRRYAGQGLVVLGVALDHTAAVRAFARQYQINYPVLVAGNAGSALVKTLGDYLGVVPYTVVLDGQGRVTATHMGAINPVRLEALVAPLVRGRPSAGWSLR